MDSAILMGVAHPLSVQPPLPLLPLQKTLGEKATAAPSEGIGAVASD